MYDSGIKCTELVNAVLSETDISVMVSDDSWYRWLSSVEQFVYTEIINEYASQDILYSEISENKVDLTTISVPATCDNVIYDDIIAVYADDIRLEKSGIIGVTDFSDKALYYSDYNGNVVLSISDIPNNIRLIYRLRPKIKTSKSSDSVFVPIEFIDMVAARMRGEAYKIANEDGLAGKWLGDYNTQLESFKIWAAKRDIKYGG